jgi:hypothetical protein
MTDNINMYCNISGPLLKKIINDTKAKTQGTLNPADRKMFVYAGHDSTISNLLSALKVWDPQIPDYGIMILIELHSNKMGSHGIKVTELTSTAFILIHQTMSRIRIVEWRWAEQPGCNSCMLEIYPTQ